MQGALRPKADDPGPDRFETGGRSLDQPARFFPYSPIIGEWSAIAPPAKLTWDGEHITGTATFGATHAGPPNMVHGGVVALLFDEVLGCANMCAGVGGFTGTLTIRYEKPTPLHGELELESHIETIEGRKIRTTGTITPRRPGHRPRRGDLHPRLDVSPAASDAGLGHQLAGLDGLAQPPVVGLVGVGVGRGELGDRLARRSASSPR